MAKASTLQISELPMSVEHHPEEPAYSLLLRALAANWVPTAAPFVARVCGSAFIVPTRIDVDAVANLTRADAEALRRSTPAYKDGVVEMFGSQIPRPAWVPRTRKYCPLCLNEHPADRSFWEIDCVRACPRHCVLLNDRCDCGRTRLWNLAQVHECQCGKPYRKCTAKPSPNGSAVEEWIHERTVMGNAAHGPEMLHGANFAKAVDAMRYLGALTLGLTFAKGDLDHALERSRAMAAGIELLSGFPERLEAALERKIQSSAHKGNSMDRVLGSAFMHWIERNRTSALVARVEEIVSRHAAATVRGRPDLSVRSTKAAKTDLVPVAKLALECGTDHSRMRRILISRNMIRARHAKGVPNGLTAEQAGKIKADLADNIGSAAAARLLRMTHRDLLELSKRGILNPVTGKDDLMYVADAAIFLKKDVEALRSVFIDACTIREHEFAAPITWAAMTLRTTEVEVLARLASGTFRSGGMCTLDTERETYTVIMPKPDWMTEADQISKRLLDPLAIGEWVSATAAAARMQVHPLHVYSALKWGLLKGFRAGLKWRIPSAVFDAFIRANVSLGRLSDRSGLSPLAVHKALRAASVFAVAGPPDLSTPWFRREEAERALGLERGG